MESDDQGGQHPVICRRDEGYHHHYRSAPVPVLLCRGRLQRERGTVHERSGS